MSALPKDDGTLIAGEFDTGCHPLEGGLADDADVVFGEVGSPCPFGYGVDSFDF
jgi:hypothetical protein